MLKEEVDEDDVAEVVSSWTGIPVARMLEGEREKLLRMEERLQHRVVGQDEAISRRRRTRCAARAAGLQDPDRPIGSFIFMGPTGVGKTELGRALAEFLFDDEDAMVRVDMSEFMEKHSVARLIGAPPGYVGYEEGGYLTEAVRRRPYSVVLLDEIEKAHPDVFNVLLQILDDGTADGRAGEDGRLHEHDHHHDVERREPVDSANSARSDADEMRRRVMDALRAQFRPEFLNRIDEIVIFNSLSLDEIKEIVDIQLEPSERASRRPQDGRRADGRREGRDRPRGVRPGLRGAAAQARAPARGAEPAGRQDPRGRVRRTGTPSSWTPRTGRWYSR